MPVAPPRQLLFVCSGNICRSPLAHYYAADRLRALGRTDVAVTSAGTLGIVGEPAHPLSEAVGREHGLDLSDHRSRGVTTFLVRESHLILVMTESHRGAILSVHPERRADVVFLGAYRAGAAGAQVEIADPLGADLDAFRDTFDEIRAGVDGLLAKLYSRG